ncbi:MAG: hypothetical protein R3B74_01885 [Nitrospirales bacterium]|nr:hypothetical protein [Nitrospirales bacterium]
MPPEAGWSQASIGRSLSYYEPPPFFLPSDVIVNPRQKVVWIYADGAQAPHSIGSGRYRVNDCSGGMPQFNSGLTMNNPRHRFEYVFKHLGTVPHHRDLQLGPMQWLVTVQACR